MLVNKYRFQFELHQTIHFRHIVCIMKCMINSFHPFLVFEQEKKDLIVGVIKI